ncbi:MAG: MBL fold metallo-hydrolase [Bacteroidetes bacterium]|nr:MBL fold metallo-hydrolase [Bacteroidota bacterium]
MQIKKFVFNPFQVNTYVLFDETGQCAIIDPACASPDEQRVLSSFVQQHKLQPARLLLTHTHIDHVLGVAWAMNTFGLQATAHPDGKLYLQNAEDQAQMFGLMLSGTFEPAIIIDDADEVSFGLTTLKVLHTPGHALGSVCYYHQPSGSLFAGDVLFHQSIGRTDLPGGDYDVLKNSIWRKLFVLPDATVVYPGHGPETTIGTEKVTNPFVAIGV